MKNVLSEKRGVYLVNILAIIEKKGKVLLGWREKDPFVKKLSWCFPGGRPDYREDLEKNLLKIVKRKTGLQVKIKKFVFAKTYTENRKILSIYYHCKYVSGKEKPAVNIKELRWVKPEEVKMYFYKSTSLHPTLQKFLKTIR